jgi:K+-sensing histidine kinase KdpD
MFQSINQGGRRGYVIGVLGVAAVTATLAPFHKQINSTTVSLALLLVVLFTASLWGSRPAFVASVLGMLCFNFFFLPPVWTFTIADPQNWVALTAFLITALTAGQLSKIAQKRTEEAEARRREIENLYAQLQQAFERESQAEAVRQSERLKSALLDAVTHDLRTPLTSIKASVTTLLTEKENGKDLLPSNDTIESEVTLDAEGRQELLEIINEETDRLNRFVESLVELARIEAGDLRLRRRWSVVDEIISAALERAAPLVREHKIVLEIEKELPAARIDSNAIAEVVYNLIENAAKYSPRGSMLTIAAHRTPDEMIEISVTDEGCGIPVELRARVFDKFFRVTTRAANKSAATSSGIGMGLAIARGIIEAHGGRIWITDGKGARGASVHFTVPIGDEEA